MKALLVLLLLMVGCAKAPLQVGHCYDKAGTQFKVTKIEDDKVVADVLTVIEIFDVQVPVALEGVASKAALTKDLTDLKEIKCEGELK